MHASVPVRDGDLEGGRKKDLDFSESRVIPRSGPFSDLFGALDLSLLSLSLALLSLSLRFLFSDNLIPLPKVRTLVERGAFLVRPADGYIMYWKRERYGWGYGYVPEEGGRDRGMFVLGCRRGVEQDAQSRRRGGEVVKVEEEEEEEEDNRKKKHVVRWEGRDSPTNANSGSEERAKNSTVRDEHSKLGPGLQASA
ncbi:hypothetical protein CPC08DRAFT_751498 [Agrocybe pediades]|nr:hypothetical protein CPC08DRAFT_751498 [Agrocybe pediades]